MILFSQKGEYFTRNYLPNKDYFGHANNFNICQNKNGELFIANYNGILLNDGVNWQTIHTTNEVLVSCIYNATDNTIYYALGETNDFGIFLKKKNGNYEYTSLLNNLKQNDQPTSVIRQIIEFNKAIYFISTDKIIEFKNNSFKVFNPQNSFNARAILIGKHLYFIDIDNQILLLKNGLLNPILNSEEFTHDKAFFTYKISATSYAIGYRNNGIVLAQYDSLNPEKIIFKKINAKCDADLIASEIINGCALSNGDFVVVSNKGGAFVLNKQLEIVNKLNTKTGLYENNIKSAYEDFNGNLWLPNYYGVSFVEINSPLRKYTRDNGISGPVQDAVYFNNKLVVATDKGLQFYNTEKKIFEPVLNFDKQIHYLKIINNRLFICTPKGLFIYDGKNILQINNINTQYIINDNLDPKTYFVSNENGIDVFKEENLTFKFLKNFEVGSEIKNIAIDNKQTAFFSSTLNGIYVLGKNANKLTKLSGLPNDKIENFLFKFNNELLIGTAKGIYIIKNKSNIYYSEPHPIFNKYTSKSEVFRAIDVKGNLLCSENRLLDGIQDKYENSFSYYKSETNGLHNYKSYLTQLNNKKVNQFTYDSLNNVTLISCDEGLYILNDIIPTNNKTYNLFLTEFKSLTDTILSNSCYTDNFKDYSIELPYKSNSITAKIGYNYYENFDVIEISYYLEGEEKTYNKWQKDFTIKYNNLFEGNYTLHVKAKSGEDSKILEMHIPFKILPPWCRSLYAYVIYGFIALAFLYLIIKLYTKRLLDQNIKLEGIVKERTATIEEQVSLLEHQKKEITDSINYAQRIQQSVLPSLSEITDTYPNYFIFFQPKDIVSGDFYWFKKINDNEFLIACCDCTGHGVPGAFMSTICSEKLSEACSHSTNPNDILQIANNSIKQVLKQYEGKDSKSKDGMEVSLIKYNKQTKQLYYSGANRSMWLIKHTTKELIEIKPNKASIASTTDFDFIYTQHELLLETNDTLYLTTDGFPDQFGGPDGRKFMTKNMKVFLIGICDLPMNEQKTLVANKINSWKGELEQIDDLLVIGFRAV